MYLIIATLTLLAAYVAILMVEAYRGVRFAPAYRERLDDIVLQGQFIVAHVDFSSFFKSESKRITLYLVHESAHLALQAVRSVERFLTTIVKRLRLHPEAPLPEGLSERHFVRTLSEFKGQLETTRPEMSEVG